MNGLCVQMISCSIVVTIKYKFDEDKSFNKIRSHICRSNNKARLWTDVVTAQRYVDRLRKKLQNKEVDCVSILIIPGVT